jgi:hypothetical protein
MKTVVTISKYLNSPITTTISKEGISLSMDMDDFVKSLKEEIGEISYKPVDKFDLSKALIDLMGKVTWKISQGNFEVQVNRIIDKVFQDKTDFGKQLDVAIENILKRIKEESIKVV